MHFVLEIHAWSNVNIDSNATQDSGPSGSSGTAGADCTAAVLLGKACLNCNTLAHAGFASPTAAGKMPASHGRWHQGICSAEMQWGTASPLTSKPWGLES